jgi:hypothetical protein
MTTYKFNDSKTPAERPQARKGEGKMKSVDLRRIIRGIIEDAVTLADDELSPLRAEATKYYHGEKFGNEEEGRSQVVITEVRDTILGVKPALLRVFFGPERQVEFHPRTEASVAKAKQATDYVQHVFAEDNRGFQLTDAVLDDGLIRQLGVFKWGWEDGQTEAAEDDALTQDQLFSLAARDDVTILSVDAADMDDAEPGDEPLFDVTYTIEHEGCARVWALPPEEFLRDREAVTVDTALFVGHRTWLAKGDLIAMGVDEDLLDKHAGASNESRDGNPERQARRQAASPNMGDNPEAGEANDLIEYVEGYFRIDYDGDGKRELRNICTIGNSYYPVWNKPARRAPFAPFVPIPEAHTMGGMSYADLTMDLQRVKSDVTRGILDSAALSIFPRTAFIEGLASVEDILNTEIGAPIRMKRDGAVTPFTHPFTGGDMMPILAYFDGVGENRTGKNKGAMSMDADALQSSTKEAVKAAVGSSQERTEVLARQFAEQALKPLFRGIYETLVEHQPKERLVKLRGEYVQVDVSSWDANMEVTVATALGTSLPEQRMEFFQGVAAKQELLLQTLGPDNPLVSVPQLRNTYAKILELAGERDVSAYFKALPPDWQPPEPPPPQPSPEQVIAQAQVEIERMKTEKDMEIKTAELLLKKEKQDHDMEMVEQKLFHDVTLRRYEIDSKNHTSHTQQQEALDAKAEERAFEIGMEARRMAHAEVTATAQHALASRQQDHAEAQTAQPEAPTE